MKSYGTQEKKIQFDKNTRSTKYKKVWLKLAVLYIWTEMEAVHIKRSESYISRQVYDNIAKKSSLLKIPVPQNFREQRPKL